MRIRTIYEVTNTVNGKKYFGQTRLGVMKKMEKARHLAKIRQDPEKYAAYLEKARTRDRKKRDLGHQAG
jgi:hypothetical protein